MFFASRWILIVEIVELACAAMLLANRCVRFGLVVLAAVIFNIVVVHLTIVPSGLPVAVAVLALWIVAALPYRQGLIALLS